MQPLDPQILSTSVPLGGRTSAGTERTTPEQATGRSRIPLLDDVRQHAEVTGMLEMADEFLASQGFTEHGFRHANLVGHIAFNVLTHLGFEERLAELGAVAGYLHDIGNVVSRSQHGQSSGLIAFTVLREMDVPIRDIAHVMGAAGNHEEQYGVAVSPISAAVIVADKSDVHRSRVRDNGDIEGDIHDRVNFAVTSSFLRVSERTEPVDPAEIEAGYESDFAAVRAQHGLSGDQLPSPTHITVPSKTLTLELEVDTSVTPVFEYFEIFMDRMVMCRRAGRTLGAEFKITVNDVLVL
ncbi:HD domain-containing protein [soil metagenome]